MAAECIRCRYSCQPSSCQRSELGRWTAERARILPQLVAHLKLRHGTRSTARKRLLTVCGPQIYTDYIAEVLPRALTTQWFLSTLCVGVAQEGEGADKETEEDENRRPRWACCPRVAGHGVRCTAVVVHKLSLADTKH